MMTFTQIIYPIIGNNEMNMISLMHERVCERCNPVKIVRDIPFRLFFFCFIKMGKMSMS